MKRCAILSMDSLSGYFSYDHLLTEPLASKGWIAETVSWKNKNVEWSQFDVVLIRSTWDYLTDIDGFFACLVAIEASGARLENSLELVKWNSNKAYLKDMAAQGINIIPTLWFDAFIIKDVQQGFMYFDSEQLIIKPMMSASADHTYRLSLERLLDLSDTLAKEFAHRPFMVQPFISEVIDEGEYSLFYFAGGYSHSILKKPKYGDFRVQEEHGGSLKAIQPSNEMLTCARHALASLPCDAFYARVDLIRYKGEFAVMEIELIEPSLYFNMDPLSPQRFADAFVEHFGPG